MADGPQKFCSIRSFVVKLPEIHLSFQNRILDGHRKKAALRILPTIRSFVLCDKQFPNNRLLLTAKNHDYLVSAARLVH